MKKAMTILITAALIAAPVSADLPDTYTSTNPTELNAIDSNSMTEDELRIAYDALRSTYSNLYAKTYNTSAAAKGIWEQKFYLDEFQNATDNAYISNTAHFRGTFSNTATNDSKLDAVIYVENNFVSISLLEYASSLVTGWYTDGEAYEVNVLTQDGEAIGMSGMLWKGATGILLNDYSARFIDLLRTGQELKVSMRHDTSSYLFTIPASEGFAELYAATFG